MPHRNATVGGDIGQPHTDALLTAYGTYLIAGICVPKWVYNDSLVSIFQKFMGPHNIKTCPRIGEIFAPVSGVAEILIYRFFLNDNGEIFAPVSGVVEILIYRFFSR